MYDSTTNPKHGSYDGIVGFGCFMIVVFIVLVIVVIALIGIFLVE